MVSRHSPSRSVRNDPARIDDPGRSPGIPVSPDRFRALAFHRLTRAGIPRSDREDVLQDLRLRLLRAERRFDARRGTPEIFVAVLLARVIADRRRSRGRRQRWCPIDSSFAIETLVDHRNNIEAVDLAMEVAMVIVTLPEPLRNTAHQLKVATKAEAARNLGVSRNTLRTRVRELRTALEKYRFRNS
jgi:DNA-directed RNA polymerase specialized sigma24 family protein